MSRSLLVLGASLYQIPTILTAKRLGFRVVSTDNVPSNPGHALADANFTVDTTDQAGVLSLARSEGVSGVISPGTDVAVTTAAYVAEQLGLPGPPLEAARTLTSKLRFREFMKQAGLPSPDAHCIKAGEVPPRALFDGRGWILKPNCSSGSKGVFIVHSDAEFHSHVGESQGFSKDGAAVLETFVDGTQHTCEGILRDGKAALFLITDRDTAAPPYTATTGHRVPSGLGEPAQVALLRTIEDVLGRLGVSDGPFDCDFVAAGNSVVLLEITPRLGGNSLSRLFRAALDFDLLAYAVTFACGDAIPLPELGPPRACAIVILGADSPGRLEWNEAEAQALRREGWVDTLLLDLPQGTEVARFINGRHRVGEALVTGADRAQVDARLLELGRRLALRAD